MKYTVGNDKTQLIKGLYFRIVGAETSANSRPESRTGYFRKGQLNLQADYANLQAVKLATRQRNKIIEAL